jgi:hypothetical protein
MADGCQTNKLKLHLFGVGFIMVQNILINKKSMAEPDL